MTPGEWAVQWKRLDQFRVGGDAERDEVEAEWFAQLKHWHIDAVEYGVTKLIGSTKDTFLPGLGLLKDYIQERIGRYDRTPGKCATCNGSGWVEVPAFKSNGLVYANTVTRCHACGIPAPQEMERHNRREKLSELEQHEYQAGRFGRDQMPLGMEAKHPAKVANPEFAKWAEQLKRKLFGVQEDAS